MKKFTGSLLILRGALIPCPQSFQQRAQEIGVCVMMIAAGLIAFFGIAPAIHWLMFGLLNFIFNKDVPL